MHTTERATSGTFSKVSRGMVTSKHQQVDPPFAIPQALSFPQSGQVIFEGAMDGTFTTQAQPLRGAGPHGRGAGDPRTVALRILSCIVKYLSL